MSLSDKIKGFMMGAVAAGLVLSASGALADPITKQIEAVYNGIKLVVNGIEVTPKDSDGKTVDPFIYDGTTYLPVRAVTQALGQDVSWDGSTNTVYVGKKPDGSIIPLTSLDYARSSSSYIRVDKWRDKEFSLAGKQYFSGLGVADSLWEDAYVVYNLNSQYKKLSGIFGVDDRNNNSGDKGAVMIIYGDDKELYRSPVTPAGNVQNIDLKLEGVNQLKITFKKHGDTEMTINENAVFVNPQLVK